jgi:hypothetical protein
LTKIRSTTTRGGTSENSTRPGSTTATPFSKGNQIGPRLGPPPDAAPPMHRSPGNPSDTLRCSMRTVPAPSDSRA